jgi:uncharacterized protein YebE (UPF0316 family)
MTLSVLLTCVLLILARIADVSLGTLRTVAIIHGRRGLAWILGFAEILIWLLAVSKVLQGLSTNIAYAISYALGFATGNYVGLTLERWIALGQQVIRIFTRMGESVARELRNEGYIVTELDGRGAYGQVSLLFVATSRKHAERVGRRVRELDPQCFYVVDDIRLVSAASIPGRNPTGWRAILKKK